MKLPGMLSGAMSPSKRFLPSTNFYEPKGKGSEAYMDLAIEFVKNNRPHEPKKARSKSAPVAEQTKNALED